jgi:hypothetical protein
MPEEVRPSGVSISRALLIRPGIANDDLRSAVEAIEQVHGDGDLPQVSVALTGRISGPAGEADGRMSFQTMEGGPAEPQWLLIRNGAPHREFISVHEVGHLIDLCGLPGLGFASASLEVPELDEWRQAVETSRAVAALDDVIREATGGEQGRLHALRSIEEIWARSYAQFVAVRSGSPALRRALDALREVRRGTVYYPLHWADDDFVSIDSAIQMHFRRFQWMSPSPP